MLFELDCWIYRVKNSAYLSLDEPINKAMNNKCINNKSHYKCYVSKGLKNIYLPLREYRGHKSRKIRLFKKLAPQWLNNYEKRKIVWVFFSIKDKSNDSLIMKQLIDLGGIKAVPSTCYQTNVISITFGEEYKCNADYFISSKSLFQLILLPYAIEFNIRGADIPTRILAIMVDYYQYQIIKDSLFSKSIEVKNGRD